MLEYAIGALIVIGIAKLWFPEAIPFRFFEFFNFRGTLWQAVSGAWPLFAWGIGITSFMVFTTRNGDDEVLNAERNLFVRFLLSIWAGVSEEILFRWLLFFSAIATVQLFNWLFFGWAGFGIPEWIYTNIMGPVADFATLYFLHDILFNGFGWAVGAAVISANGRFRDGHAYQGFIGFVNSWFCGMFFFWIMFNHGLFASMIVHALYNLFIYLVIYIDSKIELALFYRKRY